MVSMATSAPSQAMPLVKTMSKIPPAPVINKPNESIEVICLDSDEDDSRPPPVTFEPINPIQPQTLASILSTRAQTHFTVSQTNQPVSITVNQTTPTEQSNVQSELSVLLKSSPTLEPTVTTTQLSELAEGIVNSLKTQLLTTSLTRCQQDQTKMATFEQLKRKGSELPALTAAPKGQSSIHGETHNSTNDHMLKIGGASVDHTPSATSEGASVHLNSNANNAVEESSVLNRLTIVPTRNKNETDNTVTVGNNDGWRNEAEKVRKTAKKEHVPLPVLKAPYTPPPSTPYIPCSIPLLSPIAAHLLYISTGTKLPSSPPEDVLMYPPIVSPAPSSPASSQEDMDWYDPDNESDNDEAKNKDDKICEVISDKNTVSTIATPPVSSNYGYAQTAESVPSTVCPMICTPLPLRGRSSSCNESDTTTIELASSETKISQTSFTSSTSVNNNVLASLSEVKGRAKFKTNSAESIVSNKPSKPKWIRSFSESEVLVTNKERVSAEPSREIPSPSMYEPKPILTIDNWNRAKELTNQITGTSVTKPPIVTTNKMAVDRQSPKSLPYSNSGKRQDVSSFEPHPPTTLKNDDLDTIDNSIPWKQLLNHDLPSNKPTQGITSTNSHTPIKAYVPSRVQSTDISMSKQSSNSYHSNNDQLLNNILSSTTNYQDCELHNTYLCPQFHTSHPHTSHTSLASQPHVGHTPLASQPHTSSIPFTSQPHTGHTPLTSQPHTGPTPLSDVGGVCSLSIHQATLPLTRNKKTAIVAPFYRVQNNVNSMSETLKMTTPQSSSVTTTKLKQVKVGGSCLPRAAVMPQCRQHDTDYVCTIQSETDLNGISRNGISRDRTHNRLLPSTLAPPTSQMTPPTILPSQLASPTSLPSQLGPLSSLLTPPSSQPAPPTPLTISQLAKKAVSSLETALNNRNCLTKINVQRRSSHTPTLHSHTPTTPTIHSHTPTLHSHTPTTPTLHSHMPTLTTPSLQSHTPSPHSHMPTPTTPSLQSHTPSLHSYTPTPHTPTTLSLHSHTSIPLPNTQYVERACYFSNPSHTPKACLNTMPPQTDVIFPGTGQQSAPTVQPLSSLQCQATPQYIHQSVATSNNNVRLPNWTASPVAMGTVSASNQTTTFSNPHPSTSVNTLISGYNGSEISSNEGILPSNNFTCLQVTRTPPTQQGIPPNNVMSSSQVRGISPSIQAHSQSLIPLNCATPPLQQRTSLPGHTHSMLADSAHLRPSPAHSHTPSRQTHLQNQAHHVLSSQQGHTPSQQGHAHTGNISSAYYAVPSLYGHTERLSSPAHCTRRPSFEQVARSQRSKDMCGQGYTGCHGNCKVGVATPLCK